MRLFLLALILLFFVRSSPAQIVQALMGIPPTVTDINVADCSTSGVLSLNQALYDVAYGTNGLIYGASLYAAYVYDAFGNIINVYDIYPATLYHVAGGPDGNVYYYSPFGLYVLNPAAGTFTFVGDWPSGVSLTDLFFSNGQLYGVTFSGQLLEVNTNNPGQSVIVETLPPGTESITVINTNCGELSYSLVGQDLYQYNPATNSSTLLCTLPPFPFILSLITGFGEQTINCNCSTDAGTLAGGPFNLCGAGANLVFTAAGGTNLDGNDLLQYILFSDLNDTLGSIVATANTPSFAFNPTTMELGVTYYAATVAGNNSSGNVDLSDPCLDLSNALEATWHPLPEVQFAVANPNVCDGTCTDVLATFTGTPPFELTVAPSFGGNQTYNFSSGTGTFQVCPPLGTPPGNIQITALSVSDAFCTCE